MSRAGLHPGRSLAGPWLWGVQPRPPIPAGPRRSRLVWPLPLLPLLLASFLPSAWPASLLPREEEIVFPEKLNGSVPPGPGASARLLYRLPAFGETLLLELEQDPGVQVEGLTVQYLGRSPELLGGAEPGTYLTGTINGDPESVASLHWDGGALLGVLQYRGVELHLEPLEGGSLNSAGGPGAHILRRKSPASGQGPMCNVKAPPGNPGPGPRRAKVGSPRAPCPAAFSHHVCPTDPHPPSLHPLPLLLIPCPSLLSACLSLSAALRSWGGLCSCPAPALYEQGHGSSLRVLQSGSD